ncbi:alpha/beta fold hydrolase [Prosthecobacter sp.]|uniref:alpha/beta hydrolase family protein n=1 Tax=Prosthecobacter sp. TaxID=1965333 RepID=UPI001D3A42EB|nr:alpha/beta fold hydrolase [Prosthecobacter sp.]MCB1277389.1 alpha/beta fold hydrolase [Prosthecobacter sp.]
MFAASLVLLPPLADWFAADQLAHPPRRPLQNYHREFLADPSAHGVVVKSFTCSNRTPCLMCEPDPTGAVGKRGRAIREQLEKKNLVLPPAGRIVGNLVLVHGRRGRKEDYLLIAERFCAAGFRCLLPDLPAHGDHPGGTACYGVKEWPIPVLVLREAAAKFGFDPQPCGIMGISMGGAVSIRATVKNEMPWRTAVFVSTFDSLDHVVRHQASELVGSWCGSGLHWITGRVFEWQTGMQIGAANSLALVPDLKCPTLIAHGNSDSVIPVEYGRPLFEALPTNIEKRWIEIPGADHDNVLITDFPIYSEMAEWMLRHVPN